MQNKKIKNFSEAAWLFGIIFCSLGVSLSAKSGLGVSMVVAPAYVLYVKISQYLSFFTLGMAEYTLQGILILITAVVLRRFKFKYPLCFLTAVIHGFAVDIWRSIIGSDIANTVLEKGLYCISGALITAFAIALMLRTYLPQEVYELVVKEISEKYGWSINRVKWIYDISSLVLAIGLMLVLFTEFSFEMVGIGTIILTVINTPFITFFGKLLDKFLSFEPAFKTFNLKFEKILD